MKLKQRNTNIEALRIILTLGVIILHYNNPGCGGGIVYAEAGSINFYVLYGLESLFVCSVDLFMLISGYYLCESAARDLWKPIELVIQVVLFREGTYVAAKIIQRQSISFSLLLLKLIPNDYFIILYCTVYLISPFINVMISNMDKNGLKKLIVVMICLFSIYPTFVDVLGEIMGKEIEDLSSVGRYGAQWGYCAVNFILMYIVGAYLRKSDTKIVSWKKYKFIAGIAGCILLMMIWARANDIIGYFKERTAWEYCNFLVIFEAVLVFCLFINLMPRYSKRINQLSEACISVYLLHGGIIPHLHVAKFVRSNVFVMLAHIIISSVAIYLVCFCVHVIYHKVVDPIYAVLQKKFNIRLTI